MSVNRKIFSAAVIIGAASFGAKLLFAAKDLFLAATFGTSEVIDAYVIAFLIPAMSVSVVAASFSVALVPTYLSVRESEGLDAAQNLLGRACGLILLILAALAALLCVFADPVVAGVGHEFKGSKLDLTRDLFLILLPYVVLSGFGAVLAALLNARERFVLASVAPAAVPVSIVVIVAILPVDLKAGGLAWGTVLGAGIQLALLLGGGIRAGALALPRVPLFDPALRQIFFQFLTVIASSLLMCSSDIVDQVMAVSLGSGSVATLNYGNKVTALLVGVGAMGLGTAIFPYFSAMAAKSDWRGIRHTLKVYIRLVLLVTIPLTAVLWLLSEPIVRLLFERGSFTPTDTESTMAVQRAFLLQVPFYVLTILFVRLISTLRMNQFVVLSTVVSITLNVLLNYLLMSRMGVAGIALSTSIVYFVASIVLGSILWFKLPRPEQQ